MKNIKQALFGIIFYFLFVISAFSSGLEDDIKPIEGTPALNPTTGNLDIGNVFAWLKDQLFTITFVVAVAVFIFIGIRMVVARGNPEEFKKAWKHFVYAIIGILLVFAAWGIVSLIARLGSNF